MVVTLEEMKNYLRVDYDDDDALIESMVRASEKSAWMWRGWMTRRNFTQWKMQRYGSTVYGRLSVRTPGGGRPPCP